LGLFLFLLSQTCLVINTGAYVRRKGGTLQTARNTSMASVQKNNELCWIHIRDVYTFLYLGANPHEQKVGQNLKIDLSVQVPYRNTQDSLENVVDYSKIIERVQGYIQGLGRVSLLEYLAEELLNLIENEFQGVRAARIVLYKAFVPLSHFTGSVAIEVEREFAKKGT